MTSSVEGCNPKILTRSLMHENLCEVGEFDQEIVDHFERPKLVAELFKLDGCLPLAEEACLFLNKCRFEGESDAEEELENEVERLSVPEEETTSTPPSPVQGRRYEEEFEDEEEE